MIALLLLLVACDRLEPARRGMLPSELSVLAERYDGTPLSLVLGLRRNRRDQLDVRVAVGAQVYDGRRVWAITSDPDGPVAEDRVTGAVARLRVGPNARLVRLADRSAWYAGPGGNLRCDLRDGACVAGGAPPALELDHAGPGTGFHLALEHGTLRVTLPQDRDAGIALATQVARLVGVYWVHGATGEVDATLHRSFRGRARVHALPRAVDADGALDDWPDAAPLVVDAPWQLHSGGETWSGPRDASLSVAAAWTDAHFCLGGRVRDDVIEAGDLVVVQIAEVRRALPLDGAVPEGAAVVREWLGARWELCVPEAQLRARDTHPFAVSYTDVDNGETPTILASAPLDPTPLGELVLDAPE